MSKAPLIAYYGDDFTGSTDVLEALAGNGVPTALFTRIPDQEQIATFSACRAIGLAGASRSQTVRWMDAELPRVFAWLRSLRAGIVHYKVCSTFDSAPHRGSIGRAIEIALSTFDQEAVPLVVGAPELGRYTVFGQLFAAYHDAVFRIDRHPVMARHPATPMDEADLLVHLSRQTDLPSARIDLADYIAERENAVFEALRTRGARVILVDVYDRPSQSLAGRLLADKLDASRPLVFGSSGVEYALLRAWREEGRLLSPVAPEPIEPVARMAVVSGSCSAVTEAQIRTALRHGFTGVLLDYAVLASGQGAEAAFAKAFETGRRVLADGGSPILYTALGPDHGLDTGGAGDDRVGRALGRLLGLLTDAFALKRVAVAGGDTSSHALSELDIYALTLRHPIVQSPGSPVCMGHRSRSGRPSLEIVLKGGQIGKADYFVRLRDATF